MTEDHRVTSYAERQRINEIGEPLRDAEKRLCGNGRICDLIYKFHIKCS